MEPERGGASREPTHDQGLFESSGAHLCIAAFVAMLEQHKKIHP